MHCHDTACKRLGLHLGLHVSQPYGLQNFLKQQWQPDADLAEHNALYELFGIWVGMVLF